MAYYPPELAMLGPALDEELDEMVQVQLRQEGDSEINSEINLYSRFSAETGSANNQRRDYQNTFNTFEEFMNRQTKPIPMPMSMPGHDQQRREPDYLDTPYQLQTLGPSLSNYTEYNEQYNLAAVEGLNLNATSSILPPTSEPAIPNGTNDMEVKQSDSSESQAYYGTENVVRELKMEYVRWFYKTESDKNWLPFTGYDSMRIESRYRELVLREEEEADLENTLDSTLDKRPNPVNYRGYQGTTPPVSTSVPVETTCSNKQTQPLHEQQSSSSTMPSKGNNSRSKRVYNGYRSFTRKWLEWSGPNSNGTNGSPKTENSSASASSASTCNRLQWPPVPPPNNSENIIIVRGGLYEVDLENNICYATYWPDLCQIIRGTWFYDGTWQPIDPVHADKLEIEHLEKFGGASLVTPHVEVLPESPTKKNKQVAHRVSFTDFHVDWTSATEIHLYSKAVFKMSSILQMLSLRGGHRICRGYFKQCVLSDRPPEINHIVFVVHGIGQKMDTGRIVRNCAAFRDCVSALKKLDPQSDGNCRQKAEFFPVEWRSAAKLDGDIVDSITPHKLLGLRQMLNATAMDIMYYTSPLYGCTIQNALRSELNRIYSNFVKRNPNFEARGGKVSVLAHSLGAVITYDIMTTTVPQLRTIEVTGMETNEEINHEGILVIDDVTSDKMPAQPRLLFKLEHFICLGSPLAVFLALRWKEPHNPDLRSHILPTHLCKRIYNVFHPSDPVAYRLEPLLNKYYMKIAPLLIHQSGSISKRKYDDLEKEFIYRDAPTQQQPSKFEGPATSQHNGPTFNQQQNDQRQQNSSQPNSFKTISSVPMYSSVSMSAAGSTSTSATVGSSSLKSPPTPLTPTKDSNWSWFNLMKYWKSPENQNEFNDGPAMGSPEFSDLGVGSSHQHLNESDSPESSMNVHLNSPPGLNHQMEYRRDGSDDSSSHAVVPPVPNDLDYRMDFVLRESNLSSSYLAALTSHTSYWTTPDVADFFLDIIETSN